MKAWMVSDINESYECFCTVVFAETRGKAHYMALSTDCCMDSEWCDIRVTRIPEMDKMWKPGKHEMDWYDPEDRIALVKECGWYCDSDSMDLETCERCPASEWCDGYEDLKNEQID